jgi:hypothetical protein
VSQIDPHKANHIAIFGRKGSGKSVLAQRFWDSYPLDRLVIDPTGDVDPHDPKAVNLTNPLPLRWPSPLAGYTATGGNASNEDRSTLRFHPDPGSATYEDELDQAVQLAFTHGHCLLWADEVGEVTSANKTGPAMRRVLQQGRHRHLSVLLCGPRPIDINPLVISQADYLALFELPNPADRKRVADIIGFDLGEFEEAHRQLVNHGYLWWDTVNRELEVRPPLPHGAAARTPDSRFDDDE